MPTISQLASDTVPNDNDLLVTVDVNAGTTKNITREDFFTGAPLPANSVDTQALGDTGWVTLPQLTGYESMAGTGLPNSAYRVIGGVVYLRAGATGTFASGSYQPVCATVPPEYCPDSYVNFGATGNGGRGYVFGRIAPTGEVQMGWSNGGGGLSAPAWVSVSGSYPLG